ncbi:MAG: hypothetical protein KDG52_15355 [Rhodocyclaceae bacterium]|nr:hypothetical protein [Rhodocyclaceae bacterium]
MDCPRCRERTIGFRQWCRSPNAFRWICPHCGAALKASRVTWGWFLVALVLALVVVAVVVVLQRAGLIAAGDGRVFVFLGGVVGVLPVCALAYARGGYEVRD